MEVFTGEQQNAFDKLKTTCASAITLSHSKTGEQLIIQTDSSMQGLAGFMFQRDDNGEPHMLKVHFKNEWTKTNK